MLSSAFVTELQAAVVTEPRKRSLDDIAETAKAAAVVSIIHERELASDSSGSNGRDVVFGSVSPIPLIEIRPGTRSSARTLDRRNRVQQLDSGRAVVHVRRSHLDDQGNPLSVGYDMALATGFGSVRGVGASVGPPKTARMEALSTTALDQSIWPNLPRALSNCRWRAGHTPRTVHQASRRQQVQPLPQPNSTGSRFHGMPVFNTKMIPVKQRRSGTRGRPPFGFAGSGGNNGWICSQSSSLTKSDDMSIPLSSLSRDTHRKLDRGSIRVLH